jgi:cytochrome b subunit of formate dehydrogenase
VSASLLAILWLSAAPPQVQDADCLACHGETVDEAPFKASVHGDLGCTGCHEGIAQLPHAEALPKVACSSCHDAAAKDLLASVHGGGPGRDRPDCASCHGPPHAIRPRSDPASRVAKVNLAGTCGSCHGNPDFVARHKIPLARPVDAYRLSVHGRAVAKGNEAAPSCSDCHGSHGVRRAMDQTSKINHWRIPDTCGACHGEIRNAYADSVHGRAVSHGASGVPVCTDCHGEHAILAPSEPQSLVNPARVSTVTCGRCHADERLAERYNLPRDRVPAFEDSYHGLALRSGRQTVANCASCHGVHNILPSSDAASTIHPANLARTCGACHAGAGVRFAIGPVHVRPATRTEHPAVRGIRIAYWILIPFTVGLMLLHNGVDFFSKLTRGAPRMDDGEEVPRMGRHFRNAHGLAVASFLVLVVTGFALKFPESFWAAPLLRWEGRFAVRGTLHRAAGVVLVAALAYHLIHLVMKRRDRRVLHHLLPSPRDLKDLAGMLRHNLGLGGPRPSFRLFSYAEKVEYWAFLWGFLVMALTGFLLWFHDFTLRHFPTWVSDAATALHYYEAILATLSILIWHLYFVVFDPDVYPMDRAWITGRASATHLRHTRPAVYRFLTRGKSDPPPRT